MLRTLSHPLRLQILRALEHGRVSSPSEIADELGAPLNDVSYHVKQLEGAGCVELVDRRSRGGAPPASFYRRSVAHWFDDKAWKALPTAAREPISATIIADIVSEVHASLVAGRFDARPDRHLSRSPLTLDEEGWTELNEATDALLMRAHEIESRSLERLAKSDAEASRSALLDILFFEPAPTDR
jgi:DNA-binding transcriptional ArsR family regulator